MLDYTMLYCTMRLPGSALAWMLFSGAVIGWVSRLPAV